MTTTYDLTKLDKQDYSRMKNVVDVKNVGGFEWHLNRLICSYADDVNATKLCLDWKGYVLQWLDWAQEQYGDKY